jgi:hypothetical protein
MAVIAVFAPGTTKEPFGEGWIVMGRSATLGTAAADEYISKESLGLSRIISAQLSLGAFATAQRVNMVLNSRGTANAENSSPGDLAIESSGAANYVNFIVYGTGFSGSRG